MLGTDTLQKSRLFQNRKKISSCLSFGLWYLQKLHFWEVFYQTLWQDGKLADIEICERWWCSFQPETMESIYLLIWLLLKYTTAKKPKLIISEVFATQAQSGCALPSPSSYPILGHFLLGINVHRNSVENNSWHSRYARKSVGKPRFISSNVSV